MPPSRRTYDPSIEQLLDEQVDQLDRLMAEVRGGVRGPQHFDALEEAATRIGSSLRRAFREGRAIPQAAKR